MIRRRLAPYACIAALALGVPARAQDVELANAWMRPAYAGQPQAAVYVDVRAKAPLKLVGATAAVARRVELVLVDPPDPDPAAQRVVAELAVRGAGETRLAPGGSHLRLRELARDVSPGETLAVELEFADGGGRRIRVVAPVLVRGLMIHRPEPAPAR